MNLIVRVFQALGSICLASSLIYWISSENVWDDQSSSAVVSVLKNTTTNSELEGTKHHQPQSICKGQPWTYSSRTAVRSMKSSNTHWSSHSPEWESVQISFTSTSVTDLGESLEMSSGHTNTSTAGSTLMNIKTRNHE